MFKEYYKTINSINFVFEILILNASFTVSYFIRFRSVDYFYIGNAYLILQLLSNVFWFVSAVVSKVYRVDMFFRLVVNYYPSNLMYKCHLNWFYRIMQEPNILSCRYLSGDCGLMRY